MTTMRTYTCTTCGASLATSAPPGTTITCEYCQTPFTVPAPSLDQPGDSQATVVANFSRRGNPSPMPPAGPDGTPPSTPDLPPDPDSPAGVGNTVDSDASQPEVGRGPVDGPAAGSEAEAPLVVAPEATTPEPTPALSTEPELRAPEVVEDLDTPDSVSPPEPEPELPPVADPRTAAAAGTPDPAPSVPMQEGVSAADIIAEPTKYGAGIPSQQGEPILVPPNQVKIMPPQTPVAGGPPGASMRSGNRTPLLIGGSLLLLCCLVSACVVMAGLIPALLRAGGG